MITKDKKYRTVCGYEVRIYATDGGGNESTVHGAYKFNDKYGWLPSAWDCEGCNEANDAGFAPMDNLDLVGI